MFERNEAPLPGGSLVEMRKKGKLGCKTFCNAVGINFSKVKQTKTKVEIAQLMRTQVDFILQRARSDAYKTISMLVLVSEPSTKSERSTFICGLLPAIQGQVSQNSPSRQCLEVVRIVSEDYETLQEFTVILNEFELNEQSRMPLPD